MASPYRSSTGSTASLPDARSPALPGLLQPVVLRRTVSLPGPLKRPKKSNMKVTTLDQSLHSTWESGNQDPKTVGWGEISIREYARTVGDNPSCSSGPPLTIDWEYSPSLRVHSVDGYESDRPARKSQFEMVVAREERQAMLLDEWKISQAQISSAIRNNIKVKNQRRRTVNNLGKMTQIEELMESAKRKMTRIVKLQKSPSRQIKTMIKQSMQADAEKRRIWAQMDTLPGGDSAEMPRQSKQNQVPMQHQVVPRLSSRREDEGLPPKQADRPIATEEESHHFAAYEDGSDSADDDETPQRATIPVPPQNGRIPPKGHPANGQAQRPAPPQQQRSAPPHQQWQPPLQSQLLRPPQQQRPLPPQQQRPPPQLQSYQQQQLYQQQQSYQQQRPPQQYQQQWPPPPGPQFYHRPPQPAGQQYQQRPPPLPGQQYQQRPPAPHQRPPPQQYQQQPQEQYTSTTVEDDDYVFDEATGEFIKK